MDGWMGSDGVPMMKASYVVEVVSMEYAYRAVRVVVSPGASGKVVKARAANDTSVRMAYPLKLSPIGREAYLTEPAGTSIMGMVLGNPMILMMVVMGGFSFVMPMLMESLDEEGKKELQNSAFAKSQSQMHNMDLVGSLSSFAATLSSSDDRPTTKKKKKNK